MKMHFASRPQLLSAAVIGALFWSKAPAQDVTVTPPGGGGFVVNNSAGTPQFTIDASGARQVGSWAPWVGVALVGIGYLLFTSAPPGSLIFLWIALFASYAAQTLGAALLDPALSGFVGGLLIVPLTHALARFRRSPPAAVMLLPAFWLLLPGALGFRGVSSLATGIVGGATDLVVTGISIFAVALGVLVGTSVTRDARAVHRSWRISFRRAGGGSMSGKARS